MANRPSGITLSVRVPLIVLYFKVKRRRRRRRRSKILLHQGRIDETKQGEHFCLQKCQAFAFQVKDSGRI